MPNEERLTVTEMSFEQTHIILMVKGPFATEFIGNDEEQIFGNFFTWTEF